MNETSEQVAIEAAGGAAANAFGLAFGGPDIAQFVGPVAAPVFTQGLRRLASELEARGLSPWRRNRVRTACDFAAEAMKERVAAGQAPRADLFEPQEGNTEEGTRTTAEELLEEICRIAGDAADERKVPYLGRLYGSLLFARNVSRPHMRFLCKTFEALTYRQLVALAVIAEARDAREVGKAGAPVKHLADGRFAERFHSAGRPTKGEGEGYGFIPALDPGIERELDDLAMRQLIGISTAKEEEGLDADLEPPVSHPHTLWGDNDPAPIWKANCDKVRATSAGRKLVELAELSEIPEAEGETFLGEAWVASW